MLERIQTKVGIISVVGPYRTGKSYLLNRLLGRQEGFEIGSTVQSCTKGIWIWGKPIQVSPDFHVILMDTEGLNSCNRDINIDIKIFTLSVILSSYFMYNCLNSIDEATLESLSLVVNLANYLQRQVRDGELDDKSICPKFMWVVRDFALQMLVTSTDIG